MTEGDDYSIALSEPKTALPFVKHLHYANVESHMQLILGQKVTCMINNWSKHVKSA